MARDKNPPQLPELPAPDGRDDNELVPIKVKRSTYRFVKSAAAFFGLTAIEYLDRIARAAVARDFKRIAENMDETLRQLEDPE